MSDNVSLDQFSISSKRSAPSPDPPSADESPPMSDHDFDDAPEDRDIEQILDDLEHDEEDPEDLPQHTANRKQKVKTIVREFAQMSSTHGVDHMGEAHTMRVIFFWSFCLICCTCCFAYLFQDTIRNFLAYNVVVKIQILNAERTYPAVTICNVNPYKRSELMNEPALAALVQAFDLAAQQ